MPLPPSLPDVWQRTRHARVRVVGVRAHHAYVLMATGSPAAIA